MIKVFDHMGPTGSFLRLYLFLFFSIMFGRYAWNVFLQVQLVWLSRQSLFLALLSMLNRQLILELKSEWKARRSGSIGVLRAASITPNT